MPPVMDTDSHMAFLFLRTSVLRRRYCGNQYSDGRDRVGGRFEPSYTNRYMHRGAHPSVWGN